MNKIEVKPYHVALVVNPFSDKEDDNRFYAAGDPYPATDRKVSEERLAFLSGKDNPLKEPLLVKIDKGSTNSKPAAKRPQAKKAAAKN